MTYNFNMDLLFPPRVIPELVDARGKTWHKFLRRIIATDESSTEKMAFIFTMVRLNGCATCSADSFRAMQGCASCTKQSLKRYRGSDDDLIALYDSIKSEVVQYFER